MPRRKLFKTASGTKVHWSENEEGILTECGQVVDRPAGRSDRMDCQLCGKIVKARGKRRQISGIKGYHAARGFVDEISGAGAASVPL